MSRSESEEDVLARRSFCDRRRDIRPAKQCPPQDQPVQFQVRVATSPQDLNAIGRLRYRIYVEEMGKAYPSADHVRELLLDEYDLASTNLLVECRGLNGEPLEVVAAVRETLACEGSQDLQQVMNCPRALLDAIPASRLSFTTRLVVSRPYRAHAGVLLPLLLEIYKVGASRGDWVNWIHSRTRLAPMFERLGFRRFGESFWFEPSQCRHQGFVLLMDDIETFVRLNSVYAQPCRAHFDHGSRSEPALALESLRSHLHVGGGA